MSKRLKIGFLYNHEEIHQIAHTAPVAAAMAALNANIDIGMLTSTARQERVVKAYIAKHCPDAGIGFTALSLGKIAGIVSRIAGRMLPLRRVLILRKYRALLSRFDAIIVPEMTTALLKSRWKMTAPKLVFIPHGSGDRAIGFGVALRQFDLILVGGEKTRRRMIEAGTAGAGRVKITGYPKFETIDTAAKPDFFGNGRQTVVYNPHFDPKLSSWYRFGEDILDYFLHQDRYNLIVAPHVMLFERRIHSSAEHRKLRIRRDIPARFVGVPHILIDTGSPRSVDMSYMLGADIYFGDVSSQIYEWLVRPRPSVFFNSHDADWRDDPNYAHWQLGDVLTSPAMIDATLTAIARDPDRYRARQDAAFADTFSISQQPAAQRAAQAIVDFIRANGDSAGHGH